MSNIIVCIYLYIKKYINMYLLIFIYLYCISKRQLSEIRAVAWQSFEPPGYRPYSGGDSQLATQLET